MFLFLFLRAHIITFLSSPSDWSIAIFLYEGVFIVVALVVVLDVDKGKNQMAYKDALVVVHRL